MVHDADEYVANCEHDQANEPGTCLMSQRQYAGIGSLYPDAATAWRNTNHPHKGDRHPPKGAAVYWTGGSHGYGHIACSLGGGRIRSTDCTTSGHLTDVDLSWVEQHWGLTYAGWAPDINEVTIPGVGDDDMPLSDSDLEKIAHRVNLVLGDYDAEGDPRDPKADEQDQANARLKQIENVVRDIQSRVKKLEKS